jgi:copper(I)-binding protein
MKRILALSALTLACATAQAEIIVSNPWVRATVAQQQATGAFMQITSTIPVRLVAAESPIAEHVEIHEMKMDGDVMKMRQIDGLNVEPGKALELQPGGYHIMFLGLRNPVREGDQIPLQLRFESKGQPVETIAVKAMARPLNATADKHMH